MITLTLPSKQKHTDIEIKEKALNYALSELRRTRQLENYVWKAELQINGNIHFHIITDAFIDHSTIYRIWWNAMRKLGYISEYRDRFRNMTFNEYWKLRSKSGKANFEQIRKGFEKGKKTHWKFPNMVDFKSIKSGKQAAIYLAKYITKNPGNRKRALKMGNLWYCSQSLSNLEAWEEFEEPEMHDVVKWLEKQKTGVYITGNEWCCCWYFDPEILKKSPHRWILEWLEIAKKRSNYVAAGSLESLPFSEKKALNSCY